VVDGTHFDGVLMSVEPSPSWSDGSSMLRDLVGAGTCLGPEANRSGTPFNGLDTLSANDAAGCPGPQSARAESWENRGTQAGPAAERAFIGVESCRTRTPPVETGAVGPAAERPPAGTLELSTAYRSSRRPQGDAATEVRCDSAGVINTTTAPAPPGERRRAKSGRKRRTPKGGCVWDAAI
jgi:hypothetical protein